MAFGLWAISLTLGSAGCISQPSVGGSSITGRVQEGVQFVNIGGKQAAGFLHNWDLGLENRIPAGVNYRVGMRTAITDSSLKGGGEDAGLHDTQTYEPTLDVAYKNPVVQAEAGGTGLYSKAGSGGSATSFQRQDLFTRVGWTPVGMPSLRLGVDQIGVRGGEGANSDETQWQVQANHQVGPWQMNYAGTFQSTNAHGNGSDRTIDEHIGRIDYQQDLDSKGTKFAMGVLTDQTRRKESISGGTSGLPMLSPVVGLFAIDTTPLSGALASNTQLVDGDLTTPAGINIGGPLNQGGTDRNIGFDLGTALEVGAVRIYTDASVSDTGVPFYEWAVYRSDDNQIWTLGTSAAAFTYNRFLRRFEITFPSQTTRYLKVVNTAVPPAEPAILVTEIQAFGTGLGEGSPLSRRSLNTAHTTVRFFPIESFEITTSALVGKTDQTDFGVDTRNEDRLNLGLSTRYQPHPDWDFSVSGSTDRKHDAITESLIQNNLSSLFTYRPWEGLETSLTGNRRDEFRNSRLDTRSTTVGTRLGTEVSRELSSSLDVSRTVTELNNPEGSVRQWSIAAVFFAKLTREWQLNFDARWDKSKQHGENASGSPSQYILSPELIYRPGPSLIASANPEYRGGEGATGMFHRYRIDWLPFPDGSVNVELNYVLQVVPAPAADTRQGFQGRIQWNLTTRSYIEFLGTDQRSTQGSGNRVQVLQITYNVSF